jgi:hypothetical protein
VISKRLFSFFLFLVSFFILSFPFFPFSCDCRALEEQRREKIKDRLLNLEKLKTMKPKPVDVSKPVVDLQQASLMEREAAAKRKPTVEVERDELEARKRRKLEVSLLFLYLLSTTTANILESHYKLN